MKKGGGLTKEKLSEFEREQLNNLSDLKDD